MEGFDDDFAPLQSANSAAAPPAQSQNDGMNGFSDGSSGSGQAASSVPGPMASPPNDNVSPNRTSTSAKKVQDVQEEPEIIKKWKAEQAERLDEKDKLEQEAKEALREQAKKELEEWYTQHAEQLVKMQSSNRAASESSEKEFKAATYEITPGTEWERVAKLCDFNPKTARNTKDISRMRSVILQLKQQGQNSSAVAS